MGSMGSRDVVGALLSRQPLEPEDERPFAGVYDARVSKATAIGLHFTIKDYDPRYEFGPAPYPRLPDYTTSRALVGTASEHSHTLDTTTPNTPPKGTRCAVAFVNGDPDRPLVLALYGWPA